MPRFSSTVLDHLQTPRNRGPLEAADLVGTAGVPGCGRYVVLRLGVGNGCIRTARFESQGCGATVACASVLTEMLIGRSLAACRATDVADLTSALDGFPADKMHCVHLVLAALRDALSGSVPPAEARGGEVPAGSATLRMDERPGGTS